MNTHAGRRIGWHHRLFSLVCALALVGSLAAGLLVARPAAAGGYDATLTINGQPSPATVTGNTFTWEASLNQGNLLSADLSGFATTDCTGPAAPLDTFVSEGTGGTTGARTATYGGERSFLATVSVNEGPAGLSTTCVIVAQDAPASPSASPSSGIPTVPVPTLEVQSDGSFFVTAEGPISWVTIVSYSDTTCTTAVGTPYSLTGTYGTFVGGRFDLPEGATAFVATVGFTLGGAAVTGISACSQLFVITPPDPTLPEDLTLTIDGSISPDPLDPGTNAFRIAWQFTFGSYALYRYAEPGCTGEPVLVVDGTRDAFSTSVDGTFTHDAAARSYRAVVSIKGEASSNCVDVTTNAPASASPSVSVSPPISSSASSSPSVSVSPSTSPSASTSSSPSASLSPSSATASPSSVPLDGAIDVIFLISVPDGTDVCVAGDTCVTLPVASAPAVAAQDVPAGAVVTFSDLAPGPYLVTVSISGDLRYLEEAIVVGGQTTEVYIDGDDAVDFGPSASAVASIAAPDHASASATAPVSPAPGTTVLPNTGSGAASGSAAPVILAALLTLLSVAVAGWALTRRPSSGR